MEHCYKTFVSIGNAKQHFSRLLNTVHEIIDQLPQPVLIQHGHTPFISRKCTVIDFINMDSFVTHVNQAEILILHAGAGSTIQAIRAGKRPILMPRRGQFNEHVNDHQVAFATALQTNGKILMAETGNEILNAVQKLQREGHAKLCAQNEAAHLEIIQKLIQQIMRA